MKSNTTSKETAHLERKGTIPERADWLEETLRHVRETRFGQVTLTIHQGEVIEVQKTERRRFARSDKSS